MADYSKGMVDLLELDGEIIGVHEKSGHWVKFEVKRVGVPYNFQSARKLLTDFWADVDRVLKRYD